MSTVHNVKLELLRSGPAHNQLLSPLTPYLALCGADGPVTVHLPFEHGQLLTRLQRLRYVTEGTEIATGQREAELRDLGEAIGRVFGQIPALLTEIGSAFSERSPLVHLRLSIAAFELALVPFELAIGTDGFPGSGAPLFIQPIVPITVTREVRRGRPLPVEWNRKPRILFAFASPNGLPQVPAQQHLAALRRAIDPWVKWKEKPAERVKEVKSMLTVIEHASLRQLRQACAETEYTHIHLLAHGDQLRTSDDYHYGIALCRDGDRTQKEVVDGAALATALTAKDAIGATLFRPTLVSLATCDSGHPGSVLTPGGSIAHALHAGGIPWVVASQFPLWMNASTIAVEALYRGLLRGDDPRWVLYTLRQRLRTDSTHTHDWGSIVAYAVVPWNFEQQVAAFRNRQTRHRIEIKFDKAEEMLKTTPTPVDGLPPAPPQDVADVEMLYSEIRADLRKWCDEPAHAEIAPLSERHGVSGASEKRIGILYAVESLTLAKQNPKETEKKAEQARASYAAALKFYKQALQSDPKNHWVATQYLSLLAILAQPKNYKELAAQYGSWWTAVRWIALQELSTASGEAKAWALGTLAELELLGAIYSGSTFDRERARRVVEQYCTNLCETVGYDGFPAFSTRRQFNRYTTYWIKPEWNDLAHAALTALGEGASWVGQLYPGPTQ